MQNEQRFTRRERDILSLIAQDMSNGEIAERLVVSRETVKWYIKEIYKKLGVSSRDEAIARAASFQTPPVSDTKPLPSNLPARITSLIGRDGEITTLRHQLQHDDVRLLTLLGPPGIGKTRLAVETAAGLLDQFSEGIYFVPLAALTEPQQVASAIAGVLTPQAEPHISVESALVTYLRNKQVLLVLDNFEHLLPAAMLVSAILTAAPLLKILVTSREPVHVYGEQEYVVTSLSLPNKQDVDSFEAIVSSDSVTLFTLRAQSVKPDFRLTEQNASAVAEICWRLDGLPLAIELAAARIKLFPPSVLMRRLKEGFALPAHVTRDMPTRQQTLDAAIEWSYQLLNSYEQALFRRFGVFTGGWSLETIEAIRESETENEILEGLESLINKSLIQQMEGSDGESRFFLLETIREFALRKLGESGEEHHLREIFALFFTKWMEHVEPQLHREYHLIWLNRMDAEHDNLRQILAWATINDPIIGLRLVERLHYFWVTRGYAKEGLGWVERLLEHRQVFADEQPQLWAIAMNVASRLAYTCNDKDRLLQWATAAFELSERIDDTENMMFALRGLGHHAAVQGDYSLAERYFKDGYALSIEAGNAWFTCFFLNILGMITRNRGDIDAALAYHDEAVRLIKVTGDRSYILVILWETGTSWLLKGNYDKARDYYLESFALSHDAIDFAYCLEGFAGLAALQNQPELGTYLLSAAQAVRERTNTPRLQLDRYYDHIMSAIHSQMDAPAFDDAWAKGYAMSVDDAIALWQNETQP